MSNTEILDIILKDIRDDPGKYEAWIELSCLYLQSKLWKEALAAASRAVYLAPYSETVWLNRADIYQKLGDSASAEDDYTQAIIIFTVQDLDILKGETLKKRALARSIIADYQGAIDDLILSKRIKHLDPTSINLLSYCEASLEKDI